MDKHGTIPVCGGLLAMVDLCDVERLSVYGWHRNGNNHYPCRKVTVGGKGKQRPMHYEIVERRDGFEVDHINGNVLDNRRANLRYATRAQQAWNMKKSCNGNKFKGVSSNDSHHRRRKRYRAVVVKYGVSFHCGYFSTEEDAARAYDAKAQELFGEYARLNFPGSQ